MVYSHPFPSRSATRWKFTVCLTLAALLFSAAALPAGAGRSNYTAAPTAIPRVTSPRSGRVSPTPAPVGAPELLRAIPAADRIPAEAPAPLVADTPAPAVPGGRVVWMEVTAYCGCKKCCGPNAHGITASGHPVTFNNAHFIAADTSVLPFFTRVVIPGYADEKPVPVIDRGSAIKGNHIDVFFPDHETAVTWGRRWIAVTVLP